MKMTRKKQQIHFNQFAPLTHRLNLINWRSATLALALCISIALGPLVPASADTTLLWERRQDDPVAKGLLLSRIERYTPDGLLKINLLTADLSEPALKIEALMPETMSLRKNILTLAREQNAAAAINGDFFNYGNFLTPIGPVIKDGKLLASPIPATAMATVALTQDRQPLLFPFAFGGALTATSGQSMPIDRVNKINDGLSLTLFDRNWNALSPQSILNIPSLTELVVEKGIVKDIRLGQPGVPIPEEGYVVMGREAAGTFLLHNFRVGDPVIINYDTNPSASKLSFAMGTGAIILQNGGTASFVDRVPGKHPRSGVGFSQDGKTMYVITVDGRQSGSTGVTQQELAALMRGYGAWTAANLDGGGSTTLVARRIGNTAADLVNSPSGSLRNVPVGIGFGVGQPTGNLAGIKLYTSSQLIPLGGWRNFNCRGYDEYGNPVTLNPTEIQWSVSEDIAAVSSGRVKGTHSGTAVLTAKVGNISDSISFRVTGPPVRLSATSDRFELAPGSTTTFALTVIDAAGYRAPLDSADISANLIGISGSFSGNTLTAGSTAASGAVDFKALGLTRRALIKIKGGWQRVTDFAAHGGTLDVPYDFTAGTAPSALALSGKEYALPTGTRGIGMRVIGDNAMGHGLSCIVRSGDGVESTLTLTSSVDWSGSKFVYADFPAGIKDPVTLNTILVTVGVGTPLNKNTLKIEEILYQKQLGWQENLLKEAAPAKLIDPAAVAESELPDEFRLAVVGDISNVSATGYLNKAGQAIAASRANLTLVAGATLPEAVSQLGLATPPITGATAPAAVTRENVKIIFLKDTPGGLFAGKSPRQWQWLENEMATATSPNVLIVMQRSTKALPSTKEADIFKDFLAESAEKSGRNIWVVNGGQANFTWQMDRGVRYLGTSGTGDASSGHVVIIGIKEGIIKYHLKSL
jgi:hypothetical protein